MDLPENSNEIDKSWDHPWTTDEMRQKRHEWTLAADAGLLEHLKQFSNNLTENVQKTKEKLNTLTNDLNETSVIIDNITNASLALANTQFIESRVYEDDVETKQPQPTGEQGRLSIDTFYGLSLQQINNEDVHKEDLISCVSESIKQGLKIMDEKFQRHEVVASDSEDEGGIPILSIVLKPNDPYQNRPLPYAIGSDKWRDSSKIGLESSSSDSEPPGGDDDSVGLDNSENLHSDLIVNNRRESMIRRSSSAFSELSDRNEQTSTVKHYSEASSRNDKLETRSQDTLNSGSEITTPTVAQSRAGSSGRAAPSFAEELAKRLGNVLPSTKVVPDNQDIDQASIKQSKDDLFAPDDDGDVFGSSSQNLFTSGNNLFDAEISSSLWKERPIRAPASTTIPACIDVPPPIHAEATKPKSAFDDLCGDADSEDSDDIFTSKTSSKSNPHQGSFMSGNQRESGDSRENKFLKIVQNDNATNMTTSTPEMNDNGGIFGDESDGDDDDLFGNSIKSRKRITERSPEVMRAASRPKPPGISITQADLLSSKVGSRLLQRIPRNDSSDSSDSDAGLPTADLPDNSNQNSAISSENNSGLSAIASGNFQHVSQANVEGSDSSGISIRPNSTNNTFGLGPEFQPQSESTRLRSEEIFRERETSDSLFGARTRPLDGSSLINNSNNQGAETRGGAGTTLDSHPEVDFDSDDVFGPPALPKADSKSNSEVASVDDLFSNISSGSRSLKSSDLLASNEPQSDGKSTSGRSRGLFDEDIDIFGGGDAPDLDIFSAGFKFTLPTKEKTTSAEKPQADSSEASTRSEPPDLFFEPTDIGDIFSSRSAPKKSTRNPNSIFDDSEEDNDDDDLFGSSFLKRDRKPVGMLKPDDDNLFAKTPKSTGETGLTVPKKDSTGEAAHTARANESEIKPDAKRDSDVADTSKSTMPSFSSGGLFDNLEDEDDSLFDVKKTVPPKEKAVALKREEESMVKKENSRVSSMEESKLKSENAKTEGLLKESSERETPREKSTEKKAGPLDLGENGRQSDKSPPPVLKGKPEVIPKKVLQVEKGEEDISTTDGGRVSRPRASPEATGESTKRDPPKTLSIRLPMPSQADDAQAPRRAVSGKIKNLMGKMGDLKILSPTDTPPLWKKSEEKPEVDEPPVEDKDSEDGGIFSAPRVKTPPIISTKDEDSSALAEEPKEPPPPPSSPPDDSGNSESAVSFDVPAQVETLTVSASKSRARIQAKRRPQSRHARQNALRKSGIDFDTVDNFSAEPGESDPSDNTMSGISDKILTVVTDTVDSSKTDQVSDRLLAPEHDNKKGSTDKSAETISSLAPDDRSEISLSKGSSMSINKNTLLSPSTDEEDLFDVPPDLPEDPPKEDTLFGRAPILSPIDGFLGSRQIRTKDKLKESRGELSAPDSTTSEEKYAKAGKDEEKISAETGKEIKSDGAAGPTDAEKEKPNEKEEDRDIEPQAKKPMDPLRDSSHDPLKDPSQLFAFVTKTPSPEKGQNVLFKEDDSLFTRVAKKSAEEAKTTASKKKILDLFADDNSGDLFSSPLAVPAKKSAKSTKSGFLFDDIDADEDGTTDLFESNARRKTDKEKVSAIEEVVAKKSSEAAGRVSPSRASCLFGDDVDDDLFVDALDKTASPEPDKSSSKTSGDALFSVTSKISKDTKMKDLFGDQSSGEDDIFASKKIIGSAKTSGTGSLFSNDDGDDDATDIFGKKSTEKASTVESTESRSSVKKPVMRDLKKTAEKIVEDPLSMLQND